MWLPTALAILTVIERAIPVLERLLPGKGQGVEKAALVTAQATGVAEALLPAGAAQDPAIQAAIQAKIAADVALANLLQAFPTPSTP